MAIVITFVIILFRHFDAYCTKGFSRKMNAVNYLSVEKVAQIFGVSARLIYKQINSGSLPHIRIGKRIVVSDTDLEKYITRNQHPAQRFDQK